MKEPLSPAEIFNKHAALYQQQYQDISRYEDTFDLFCSSIRDGNAVVLEVACGPGNVTQYLLAKRPELQILGTDVAPNMIQLAQTNNPTASFQVMDARDIGKLPNTYDAILCGFGFPYLSKEEALAFIAAAAHVLNTNGVLYISTMEDDYSKSGIKHSVTTGDSTYMYYHEAGYLTEALQAHHFHILLITRKSSTGADGTPYTDLIIIARK